MIVEATANAVGCSSVAATATAIVVAVVFAVLNKIIKAVNLDNDIIEETSGLDPGVVLPYSIKRNAGALAPAFLRVGVR